MEIFKENICACLGPQEGEPVCPCAMRWVKKVDGRYVNSKGEDLGPIVFVNKSRIEKQTKEGCYHAGHNPDFDMINSLALGEVYIHVCPQCKAEYNCMPSVMTFLNEMFKDEENS